MSLDSSVSSGCHELIAVAEDLASAVGVWC